MWTHLARFGAFREALSAWNLPDEVPTFQLDSPGPSPSVSPRASPRSSQSEVAGGPAEAAGGAEDGCGDVKPAQASGVPGTPLQAAIPPVLVPLPMQASRRLSQTCSSRAPRVSVSGIVASQADPGEGQARAEAPADGMARTRSFGADRAGPSVPGAALRPAQAPSRLGAGAGRGVGGEAQQAAPNLSELRASADLLGNAAPGAPYVGPHAG